MDHKRVIYVCGPTAAGKTAVAITIAQELACEIISFDSRQFYKELQIGAAPPNTNELAAAKHHFIGHLRVNDEWSAGQFAKAAEQKISELHESYNDVILVGGSGLYMKALSEGFDEMPEIPVHFREELNAEWQEHGIEKLQQELKQKDPEYFEKVDQQNPQRLIRALEVIRHSGDTFTAVRKGHAQKEHSYTEVKIGITLPRPELYERINLRVDKMMEAGLPEEVKSLIPHKHMNALQTVGYKELFSHFEGELSLDEAVEEIKKNSRRYAKRQLTWFRRDDEIKWFSPFETEAILTHLYERA